MEQKRNMIQTISLLLKHELLFCDVSPLCYKISAKKEIVKRSVYNFAHRENYLKEKRTEGLPNPVFAYQAGLIKRGKGIDPETQYNKSANIAIAAGNINGVILHPGEKFSFWRLVGRTSKKNGYKEGRVIEQGRLTVGLGGGLCNLANVIHLLVLYSPLEVTEVHYHSDALSPDHGKRIPMSSGTSVSYNNIDLQFKNRTDQDFQILVKVDNDILYAELRSEKDVPYSYAITEEDHHFRKEGSRYFRISKIYRDTIDKKNGCVIKHDLILDNHSEVMFDPSQIPQELIRV